MRIVNILLVVAARAQERPLPSPACTNKLLEPLAVIEPSGALRWAPFVRDALEEVGIELPKEGPQPMPVAHAPAPINKPPDAIGIPEYLSSHRVLFVTSRNRVSDQTEQGDAYCLRGPAALATTQARKPASPRLMDQEPDPFEMEMEIERELESECWG